MAGPHRRRVDAVCSIEFGKHVGHILYGDETVASRRRAARTFFRELAGRTIDSVLLKKLARLRHRAAGGIYHR